MEIVADNKPASSSDQPATKGDIESVIWPPKFTRDIRLQKMQDLLKHEEDVLRDPTLSDADKVRKVAGYKQRYNIHDNDRFETGPVGAIPPTPLPVQSIKSEDETTNFDLNDLDYLDDLDEEEEDIEEDVIIPEKLPPHELFLKNVPNYRKGKARSMLNQLAAEGSLRWDHDGNITYKGKPISNANMHELVNYFQTAHKKTPMDKPIGNKIFGYALRKAGAINTILLGGDEDNDVRELFLGLSPKTPRFQPYSIPKHGIKRKTPDRDRLVSTFEL